MAQKPYIIVYNLALVPGLDILLPTGCICNVDASNQPTYLKALAMKTSIESYFPGFDFESPHGVLMSICHDLTVPELEAYVFRNRKRKKHESLLTLFEDKLVKARIQSYIDRKIEVFLNLIQEHNFFLCLNLQRKVPVKEVALSFESLIGIPQLKFIQTQTGIKYCLTIQVGEHSFLLSSSKVYLLTHYPGYILRNNFILKLAHIDTAKLKPFLKSDSVFIPERSIKMYFETFVSDMLNKVEIEAEGFEVKKEQTLESAEILFVFPFDLQRWCVDIRFKYKHFSFLLSDKIQKKHRIHISDSNTIAVLQCDRDLDAEQTFVNVLLDYGFEWHEKRILYAGSFQFSTILKIIKLKSELMLLFTIAEPEIDNKRICLQEMQETMDFVQVNDWFDLKGHVWIEDKVYPFFKLFTNIKNENPYFKLSDGRFAIIPEEIMMKYCQIAKYTVISQDSLKLAKVHFPLLKQTDIAPKAMLEMIEEVDYVPSEDLKAGLRPYQIEGVKWLIKHRLNGLGACLADDMGLGKTLQTIAVLLDAKDHLEVDSNPSHIPIQLDLFGEIVTLNRKALHALIVLPTSLIFNWHHEIKKFAPSLQVVNYTGSNRKAKQATLMSFDVILTTYQTLVSEFDFFKKQRFYYIILDESQQIRNKNSKSFQAVHQLNADNRLSLSGTPIENSLADLWAQMEFINPDILGSFANFKSNFMLPIEKNQDEHAKALLKQLISPYILRRTKEEVAKDLPDLVEMVHYVEMPQEQASLYEKEKSAARNFLAGLNKSDHSFRFNVLTSLMRLRQLSNHPGMVIPEYSGDVGKFDAITDQIKTVVRSGHKVLVFSSFLGHMDFIRKWMETMLINYVMLTGQSRQEERKRSIMQFQEDKEVKVFLISIKAGGTGLNLTAADYVFILDPWWNPFVEKQAIARAHRIGQTQNVLVTRFITRNTIEERILNLQAKKKKLSNDIIDEDNLSDFTNSELEQLLE
ncbi:MAG: DEAD/DEAH box helicase [Chitinophagales bacterium]|nr:DEAD/DEAH box helicase [Chitinophagales bacterium]